MKKSAIMQMFYGERGHCDLVPCSQEYFRLLNIAAENSNILKEKLKEFPDLLKLYEITNDSIEAMHCESVDNHYLEGFRFGLLMGIDVMRETID